jgi:rRNA-processing protein FCF1
MKLGMFAVGLPLYEIESDVTHQTVRTPTVFERMVMRLCGRYRTTPEIAGMTLSQIFEQQLGVASASELVGPSVENLIYLGILVNPVSQNHMVLPLADLSLTTDGLTFLERDRLPSRSQQVTVSHLFYPLSNSVKLQRADNRLLKKPRQPYVSDTELWPLDCSALVREAVEGERYTWKSPSTEIHSVQSHVVRVVWDQHQISLECDESGVLTIKAPDSPDLDRWLAMATPDVVWNNILEPILAADVQSDWPDLSANIFRTAIEIAPLDGERKKPQPASSSSRTALRVLSDESQLEQHPDEDLVLLTCGASGLTRLPSKQGTIRLEIARPSELPTGLDMLLVCKDDLSPAARLTGFAKVFWASQVHRAVLSLTADKNTSLQVWSAIQSTLQSGLNSSQDADVFALAAIWESPHETILRWQSRVASLQLSDLIADASIFAPALERFSHPSGGNWKADWQSALNHQLVSAISHLDNEVALEDILAWLTDIDRLLPVKSRDVMLTLLAHCESLPDAESVSRLRTVVGPSLEIPGHVFGDAPLRNWVSQALSDEPLSLFGPHAFVETIDLLRSAYFAVLRDVGNKSLDDAEKGTLSLKSVKTSALASIANLQSAISMVRNMRIALVNQSLERLIQIDRKVSAWQELASQRLAPPAPEGHKLVVLDTNALMDMPDLLGRTLQRGGVPIVPRRVLEELDGLKGASSEEKAKKARSAIRALERAGRGVKYESEVVELLPPDWDVSPDNRILSVALYHRLSDVVLVTGDINLRTKALAENMKAMLPGEYLGISSTKVGGREKVKGRR